MPGIEEPETPPELPEEYAATYREAYLRALAETAPAVAEEPVAVVEAVPVDVPRPARERRPALEPKVREPRPPRPPREPKVREPKVREPRPPREPRVRRPRPVDKPLPVYEDDVVEEELADPDGWSSQTWLAILVVAVFLIVLAFVVGKAVSKDNANPTPGSQPSTSVISTSNQPQDLPSPAGETDSVG